MLNKNKNIVAKLKNQNGDDFIFHLISRHFNFVDWQH
jgi:hypothetical protein